jgi:vacuolar protein sorting-associated protein 16
VHASSSHLVNRLTARNLHLLALRISTYLSLKPDPVLKHWACAKIAHSKPVATAAGQDVAIDGDDDVCRSIVDKFSTLGGASVSYADIAKRAWEVGRLGLATKVSNYFLRVICRHELTPEN